MFSKGDRVLTPFMEQATIIGPCVERPGCYWLRVDGRKYNQCYSVSKLK